jgi:N-acetyl-D-muramate 6-phosphate phosphatase
MSIHRPRLVLFDLDGTLADTAPDLAATANRMREVRGLVPLPYAELRPLASHGARGLIGRALGVGADDARFAELREEFFVTYERALCVHSRLFDGMAEVLALIEATGRWGIVTNKVARFTGPLVEQLGLATRATCVVSGDTTPHAKPHPAPVLHALAACGEVAANSIYVGDDLRDVQAGAAAGLRTVAVRYGYLGEGLPIEAWGADVVIDAPRDLLSLLA